MKRLQKLFDFIELNGLPGCCKTFSVQVFKRKGQLKLDPVLLQTGTDSGPLLEFGLIKQNDDNKVDFTEMALLMID